MWRNLLLDNWWHFFWHPKGFRGLSAFLTVPRTLDRIGLYVTTLAGMLALLLSLALSDAETIDVSGDGKVQKVVLQKGTGAVKPEVGQKVVIKYTGWLADGKLFDSSNTKDGTFTFVVGRGVIPAWSMTVQTMTVGEKAKITVDYQYGFGERGYPPIVPARTSLTFELELVKILSE